MSALSYLVSTRFAADVAALVLVKGTLLLAAVALAARWFRSCPACVRHRLWTGALIGLVAVPAVTALLPQWGPGAMRYPAETMLVGLEAIETTAAREAGALQPATGDEAGGPILPLPSLLLLGWWVGALAVAVRIAFDLGAARRLRTRSRTVDAGEPLARLLDQERRRLGIHRDVTLLIAPDPGLAATMGTIRPCVVIGTDVAAMPLERLRALFVHELAHVRRRDHATHLLTALGMPLYWPNPLYWWARRRAALEREQACDQEVLRGGVTPARYAQVLLDFATARGTVPTARHGTHGLLSFSPTRTRIHAVLDGIAGYRPVGAFLGTVVAVSLLAFALPASSVKVHAFEPGTGPTVALVAALSHADPSVRARAARTIGRRDAGPAREELERLLDDSDARVRLAAAGALEQLADPASLPAVARVLARPFEGGAGEHGFVLKLAIRTAARIESPEAFSVLEAQLDRPEEQLRWLALESMLLSSEGVARARPYLQRFADGDPSARNRRQAAEALARIDGHHPTT